MSKYLKKHWCYVKLLATTTNLQRRALLKTGTSDQVKTLCEIIHNVVYNDNLIPSKKYVYQLKSYRASLRRLSESKCTARRRRELLLRISTVLPKLLKPLLDTLEHSLVNQHGY